MDWIIDGLLVCLVSVAVSGIIIPQILLIAFRKKLFDELNERKIHTAAVPRLGGLAFVPSILLSLCLVIGFKLLFYNLAPVDVLGFNILKSGGQSPLVGISSVEILPLCFGLSAVIIMYLIGIADDLVGVRYRAKFVAQIMASLLLVAGGARIDNLHGFLGVYELPIFMSCILTVILVVFIINAINLIDGLDGLASGLSAIAMVFYAVNFILADQWAYSLLAFAVLGTLIPFFFYNVFGNAAMGRKIFMGDSGSLTTGILISFLAMETTRLTAQPLYRANLLVVAFAPLAIPCLDMLRVFIHRILRGKSPFLPDRSHIHHKLLALGLSQRTAMIAILAASACLVVADIWLAKFVGSFVILLIDLAVFLLSNWQLTRAIHSRERRLGIDAGYE